MLLRYSSLLALAILLPSSFGKDVQVSWNITYTQADPTTKFERRVIGVNGKWPIDPIFANLGDTLYLNVNNQLNVPTAIHSHGLFQNGTAYYDGAAGITECGIPPSASKTYAIPIQQTGSYWSHGHAFGQYVDGLRAPLILLEPNQTISLNSTRSDRFSHSSPVKFENYTYSDEYIVSLSDWYHQEHSVLLAKFQSITNPMGAEPVPDLGLINHGINRSFDFTPGTTYRLRLICMSAFASFDFYIDDHDLVIIEVDGVPVKPYSVKALPISAAQRYSVLVTAKNSTGLNYLLHADMHEDMFDSVPPGLESKSTATIVYAPGAPLFEVPADFNAHDIAAQFDDMQLSPVTAKSLIPNDVSFPLMSVFDVYTDGKNHGAFNETVFSYPNVPTLLTAATTGPLASRKEVYGPNTNALVVEHLKGVEIIINNVDPGTHPFHLHGHEFQVVGRGEGGVFQPTEENLAKINALTNPVRRDTVIVPGDGWAVIRVLSDNPGTWLFHCHIEWHLQAGLALVLVEAPNEIQSRLKIPSEVTSQCTALSRKTSGNAAGFNDATTFDGLDSPLQIWPKGFGIRGSLALAGSIASALVGLVAVLYFADTPKDL